MTPIWFGSASPHTGPSRFLALAVRVADTTAAESRAMAAPVVPGSPNLCAYMADCPMSASKPSMEMPVLSAVALIFSTIEVMSPMDICPTPPAVIWLRFLKSCSMGALGPKTSLSPAVNKLILSMTSPNFLVSEAIDGSRLKPLKNVPAASPISRWLSPCVNDWSTCPA